MKTTTINVGGLLSPLCAQGVGWPRKPRENTMASLTGDL